jgi:hypothetical protein
MPLVLVEWIDSHAATSWRPRDEMLAHVRDATLACKSVGWLLLDAPDRITVVATMAENGSVADATTIPKSAVVSVVVLSVTRLDLDPDHANAAP